MECLPGEHLFSTERAGATALPSPSNSCLLACSLARVLLKTIHAYSVEVVLYTYRQLHHPPRNNTMEQMSSKTAHLSQWSRSVLIALLSIAFTLTFLHLSSPQYTNGLPRLRPPPLHHLPFSTHTLDTAHILRQLYAPSIPSITATTSVLSFFCQHDDPLDRA